MAEPGIRLTALPDLGAVTDTSSFAGARVGVGRFLASALRDYLRVAIHVDEAISPKNVPYNAKGDGTTDDTAAFEAALAACIAGKRPMSIPAGRYRLTRQLVGANAPVAIIGAGKGITTLVWDAAATSKGLSFTFNSSDQHFYLRDLSLLTNSQGGTGVLLDYTGEVDGDGNTVDRTAARFCVENVVLAGAGDAFATGWAVGIDSIAAMYSNVVNVDFVGYLTSFSPFAAGAAHGFRFRGTSSALPNGRPCCAIIDRCNVNYATNGVTFSDYEGCWVTASNIVGVSYGVVYNDVYGRPQLNVCDTHINAYGTCILAVNNSQMTVTGCLLYRAINATGTVNGVVLQASGTPGFGLGWCIIANNQFQDTGAAASAFVGVLVQDGTTGIIDGNVFRKNSIAIAIGANADRMRIGAGNVFDNVAQWVSDSGTNTRMPGSLFAEDGQPVVVEPVGIAANIDIALRGKGTGTVGLGDTTAQSLSTVGALNSGGTLTTFGTATIGGDLKHIGTKAGFYGIPPINKPTVTGSVAGNAAVASLVTALTQMGLITNTTSS